MQRGVELLPLCWTADPGQQAPGEMGKETLSTPALIHPSPAKPAFSTRAKWRGAEFPEDPGYSHRWSLSFSIKKSIQLLKPIP